MSHTAKVLTHNLRSQLKRELEKVSNARLKSYLARLQADERDLKSRQKRKRAQVNIHRQNNGSGQKKRKGNS